jgi:hypothetical protein
MLDFTVRTKLQDSSNGQLTQLIRSAAHTAIGLTTSKAIPSMCMGWSIPRREQCERARVESLPRGNSERPQKAHEELYPSIQAEFQDYRSSSTPAISVRRQRGWKRERECEQPVDDAVCV